MNARFSPTRWRALLLFLGALFLVVAIVSAFHSIDQGLPSWLNWDTGDAATASAGFATVAAIFLGLYQFQHQGLSDLSKFALEMATAGVQRAHTVLREDKPTRNIAWVNAARLLSRSQDTATGITEQDHVHAWELFHEEWRIRFHEFLRCGPRYYFGLDTCDAYQKDIVIDDEAVRQMLVDSARVTKVEIDGFSSTGFSDTILVERAIRVIYEFAKAPANWTNHLAGRSAFTSDQVEDLNMQGMNGLLAFIKIRRKYDLVDGTVVKRALRNDDE